MFMDVTTDFGKFTPTDFDQLERGPLRLRRALQFSLNIPAVKALAINGIGHVYDMAREVRAATSSCPRSRRACPWPSARSRCTRWT